MNRLRNTPSTIALMAGIRWYGDKPMGPPRPWTRLEWMEMLTKIDLNSGRFHG